LVYEEELEMESGGDVSERSTIMREDVRIFNYQVVLLGVCS
jgi:hypothetical protein